MSCVFTLEELTKREGCCRRRHCRRTKNLDQTIFHHVGFNDGIQSIAPKDNFGPFVFNDGVRVRHNGNQDVK